MLDTFPFNGHTTVCDTLWQGVTVVALAGQLCLALGSSALVSLGLEDCIAHSTAEYVRIATRLANDLDGLASQHRNCETGCAGRPSSMPRNSRESWRPFTGRCGPSSAPVRVGNDTSMRAAPVL